MAQIGTLRIGNTKILSMLKKKKRAWCFTLHDYNENDIGTLIEYFSSDGREYVFQKEKCPESGRLHLQGTVRFPNAVYCAFQENFRKQMRWEYAKNWRRSKIYCSKRDTRIDNIVYTNVKGIRVRKKLISSFDINKMTWWQDEILNIIKTEADLRKVYWYWSEKGNLGKSILVEHIYDTNPGCYVVFGTSRDIFCGISRFVEEKDLDVLLIDVPRSKVKDVSYTAIEKIKDRLFFSGKYESSLVRINPCHVFVFANEEPDFDQLSEDRWIVTNVDPPPENLGRVSTRSEPRYSVLGEEEKAIRKILDSI